MNFVDKNKGNLIKDLSRLINIPSVSTDKEEVEKALDETLAIGERLGFRTEKLLNGQIGIIEAGQGEEVMGILAHVDVVSPGNLDYWESPPFCLTERDGKLYGRGALDDKGPIIASLYALKGAIEEGLTLKKTVRIILGTQEEDVWSDMDAYCSAYPPVDYGFTPDGGFPICNIEKGCMDVCLSFPIEPIDEPEDCPQIVKIEAGVAANIIPDKCIATLSDGREIIVSGKTAHSCHPSRGENAIFVMDDYFKNVTVKQNKLARILHMLNEKFSDYQDVNLGIETKDAYFMGEYIDKNVLSPTIIKTKGNTVEININVRFAYTTSAEELVAAFERLCAEYGGSVKSAYSLPAVFVSRENKFLKEMSAAYEQVTGRESGFDMGYGASYSKVMPNIVSWGPVFPGETDTCHQENEYISADNLLMVTKIYQEAIERIACSEASFIE